MGAYVLDLRSGVTRRLTSGRDASIDWLGNGSGLLLRRASCWSCDAPPGQHVFVPAQGGREEDLAHIGFFEAFGGFASDSRHYLYSNDAVRIATLDGEEKAITDPDPMSAYLALSCRPLETAWLMCVDLTKAPGRIPSIWRRRR